MVGMLGFKVLENPYPHDWNKMKYVYNKWSYNTNYTNVVIICTKNKPHKITPGCHNCRVYSNLFMATFQGLQVFLMPGMLTLRISWFTGVIWLLRNSLFGTLQGTSISSLKVARKVGYVSSQVGHASSQEGKFPFQHRGGYFGAVETQVRNTGGKPRWEEVEDGEIGRWTLKVLDSHPGNANWECHF